MSLKSIAYVGDRIADTLSEEMLKLVMGSVIHYNQAFLFFSIGMTAWQLLRPQDKSYERLQM